MPAGRPKGLGKSGGRVAGTPNKTAAPIKEFMTKFVADYLNGDFQTHFANMSDSDQVKVGVDLVKHFVPKAKDESEKELEATATSALRRLFIRDDE